MYPKISIITPSYNQGQFLEETITSVLDQKYPNLEFMIIDGGSKDNSVEIIKRYEKYLEYWVSEKDNGQTHAINKGLAKVTGDIVNWLCSDDYLEPGALHKIAEEFGNDQDIHIVCGNLRLFNTETGFEQFHQGTILQDTLPKTIVKSYLSQPSAFFRTKYFFEIKMSDLLQYYMDYELWVKYLLCYGQEHFKKIDDLLVHYRLHETSKTVNNSQTSLDKKNNYTIERNAIMYSIALNAGLNDKLDAIRLLSDKFIDEYNINVDFKNKKELAEKIINYYLYFNAIRYYYEINKKDALYLLKNVDKSLLNADEQLNYKTLRKNSYFDPYLSPLRNIKFLRQIKNIYK